MPLIHSKRPAAFKKNIETEIAHGKPQKQAVAIAYSEKRAAEHKYGGGECGMCGGGQCKMAEGGSVKGVHSQDEGGTEGHSKAGWHARDVVPMRLKPDASERRNNAENMGAAKDEHHKVLGQITAMKGKDRKNLAEGGEVGAEAGERAGDEEISHGLGKELLGAFESKDHKAVMSALEAAVLHCMNREDPEET